MSKFIRIGIADKNDNPPYFDKALYEAEVDENEDIQHTVLTVTAKDHDECKCWEIYCLVINNFEKILIKKKKLVKTFFKTGVLTWRSVLLKISRAYGIEYNLVQWYNQ